MEHHGCGSWRETDEVEAEAERAVSVRIAARQPKSCPRQVKRGGVFAIWPAHAAEIPLAGGPESAVRWGSADAKAGGAGSRSGESHGWLRHRGAGVRRVLGRGGPRAADARRTGAG